MTGAVSGELISPSGYPKLGWLKAFEKVVWNLSVLRSVSRNSFIRARSMFFIAGVCRMLTPELPNLPMLSGLSQTGLSFGQPGTRKAATLNQLSML